MTERKPPGVPFESWVDKQIREATERGAFDNLPGAGKPLASMDRPYDELWWIREKMAREGLSHLPASLVLRKEVEDAMEAASRAPCEREVRRIVEEVNDKIRTGIRTPMDGPPLNLVPYDVDEVVARWREGRS
jgi:hypothetical protein